MNYFDQIEPFLNAIGAGIGSQSHTVACQFAAFLSGGSNQQSEPLPETPEEITPEVTLEPAPEPIVELITEPTPEIVPEIVTPIEGL